MWHLIGCDSAVPLVAEYLERCTKWVIRVRETSFHGHQGVGQGYPGMFDSLTARHTAGTRNFHLFEKLCSRSLFTLRQQWNNSGSSLWSEMLLVLKELHFEEAVGKGVGRVKGWKVCFPIPGGLAPNPDEAGVNLSWCLGLCASHWKGRALTVSRSAGNQQFVQMQSISFAWLHHGSKN